MLTAGPTHLFAYQSSMTYFSFIFMVNNHRDLKNEQKQILLYGMTFLLVTLVEVQDDGLEIGPVLLSLPQPFGEVVIVLRLLLQP